MLKFRTMALPGRQGPMCARDCSDRPSPVRIDPRRLGKVARPFVIANGPSFGLFFTHLKDAAGTPTVSFVRLDHTTEGRSEPFYLCIN